VYDYVTASNAVFNFDIFTQSRITTCRCTSKMSRLWNCEVINVRIYQVTILWLNNCNMGGGEIHRYFFHPLATMRHRIWAGPEKRPKKKTKTTISKTATNIFFGNKNNVTAGHLPVLSVLLHFAVICLLIYSVEFKCWILASARHILYTKVCVLRYSFSQSRSFFKKRITHLKFETQL